MKRLREHIGNAMGWRNDPPPAPASSPEAVPLLRSVRQEKGAGGVTIVVALAGEIDLRNSPDMRTELLDLVVRHHPAKFVLNLSEVPYMDSSAVAVMVETLQHLRRAGGKVFLTNLQPRVKGLIEIARLNTIFVICADESEALTK